MSSYLVGMPAPCSALWDAGRSGLEGHVMATSMHRQRRNVNSADGECVGAQSITKKAVFEDPSTKKAGRATFACSVSSATGKPMPVLTPGTARQRETEDGHLVEPGFAFSEEFRGITPFGCSCFAAASRRAWTGSGCRSLGVVDSAAAPMEQVIRPPFAVPVPLPTVRLRIPTNWTAHEGLP